MTSTPSEPRLYDVWLMWVEFPDHPGIGKPRPVVITEVDGDLVSGIVAKINHPRMFRHQSRGNGTKVGGVNHRFAPFSLPGRDKPRCSSSR